MNRESRTKVLQMRVTPSEYGLIERAATLSNQLVSSRYLGISEFVRSRILADASSIVRRSDVAETELLNEEETIG